MCFFEGKQESPRNLEENRDEVLIIFEKERSC